MSEIVNCLPSHAQQHFLRLRNETTEAARTLYTRRLADLRGESAAKGVIQSGSQLMKEWELAETFLGDLTRAYFDSTVQTCSLYEITLDPRLTKCLEDGLRAFIVAQYRNAIVSSGMQGGHIKIPLHLRTQIASNCDDCRFPLFNSIMIQLENARVKSVTDAQARKAAQTTVTTSSATTQSGSSLRTATVIRILIASPGDVTKERDLVTDCIYAWNAAHSGTTGIMLQPVRWETHTYPVSGDRPQALINRQIVEDGDCLIGIFGARLGTPTGDALSGTIEEIEIFRDAGKHVSLYFSMADVPRNADREQLTALENYQCERQKDTLYAEFSDAEGLRRLVTQHLPGIVRAVRQAGSRGAQSQSHPAKNELARLFLRTRPGSQSGDVKTVQVSIVLENVSDRRKITDYVCTLSIPRACLTHTSSTYMGEIRKEDEPNRRFFRVSNHDPGRVAVIFQGDKVPLFALDIGVDQLLMKGTYLAGDYEGTLADKVVAEAVVEGEILRMERTVADVFANPNQG
jgi:hypothetical protein